MDPGGIPVQIAKYPRSFQIDAWTKILTGMMIKVGIQEMSQWKEEHVPAELTNAIMASPHFNAPLLLPDGEDPRQMEEWISSLPVPASGKN